LGGLAVAVERERGPLPGELVMKKRKNTGVKVVVAFGPITKEMIQSLPIHVRRSLAKNIFGFFARLDREEAATAKLAA